MPTITMPTSGPYAAVAALLASPLPLPPGAPARAVLEASIEHLVDILDAYDSVSEDLEPQCEDEGAACEDEGADVDNPDQWRGSEPDVDDEPDLGWPNPMGRRFVPGPVEADGLIYSSTMSLEDDRVPDRRVRRPVLSPDLGAGAQALEDERRAVQRSARRVGELVAQVEASENRPSFGAVEEARP